MSKTEINAGVELASGKAKGAVGVVESLKMCLGVIKHSRFERDATHCYTRESASVLTRLLQVIEAVWGMVHNRALSAEYTMHNIAADQRLMYGNVFIDIGNYHAISLHWEALTACARTVVEAAVLNNGGPGCASLITREPVRFDLAKDGVDELTSWVKTMIYAVGNARSICDEECPDFPMRREDDDRLCVVNPEWEAR